MATRFGNFKELSQGKKPITADEAYLMLKELGMLGNQFIPGAESLGMLLDGKSPYEAAMALQDWIPGNAAYQNWLNDRPQDWSRNAVDAAVMAVPAARGATKAAGAIERTFGGKLGPKAGFTRNPVEWNKLTPEQQKATDAAIDEWNNARALETKKSRVEQLPEKPTFKNDFLNEISDDYGNTYFLSVPWSNKVDPDKIVSKAILPENPDDAAFLRHQMTNYDIMFKLFRKDIADAINNKTLKPGLKTSDPRKPWSRTAYVFTQPSDLGWSEQGDRLKYNMLMKMEEAYPGYIDALEGKIINSK